MDVIGSLSRSRGRTKAGAAGRTCWRHRGYRRWVDPRVRESGGWASSGCPTVLRKTPQVSSAVGVSDGCQETEEMVPAHGYKGLTSTRAVRGMYGFLCAQKGWFSFLLEKLGIIPFGQNRGLNSRGDWLKKIMSPVYCPTVY